jgi:hypothetical protein
MESRQFNKRLWSNRGVSLDSPEGRLKPQLVDALDKDADVMTQNLAKDFVDLSDGGFCPNRTPKLSLYHREGGFDIRPLVIVLHKGFLVEVVEVPHSLPETIVCPVPLRSLAVVLEGYIGHSVDSHHSVKVLFAGIRLVSRNFPDVEGLGSCVQKRSELRGISRLGWGDFGTGYHMGFDSTYQMGFYPLDLAPHFAPLVVKPSGVSRTSEPRGINGKVSLDCPQRAGGLLDKGLQDGCQFGLFKVAGIAGEGRELANQFLCLSFPNGSHEASARHSGVDFVGNAENHISQRESGSAESLLRLGYAIAQVPKQHHKAFLFVHLGCIIGCPFLRAGHFDGFGIGGSAVWLGLPLDYELHCVNMLAGQVAGLEVGAGAERLAVVEVYDVSPVARLGRHFPAQLILFYLACVGYNQPSFLSCVHFNHPYLSLLCAYYSILSMVLSIVFMSIYNKLPIDNGILSMVKYSLMNEIQNKLAELREKGWTLANIARELGQATVTVESWNVGIKSPGNLQSVLIVLDQLAKRKRIPKRRRYTQSAGE